MPWWGFMALLVAALGFGLGAVNLARVLAGAARRRSRGTTTSAVVVQVEERGESNGEGMVTVFIPTLEFHDTRGRTVRFRNPTTVPDCPGPGGTLTAWYDPDDQATPPEVVKGRVGGAVALWLIVMALFVGMAAFAIQFSTVFAR